MLTIAYVIVDADVVIALGKVMHTWISLRVFASGGRVDKNEQGVCAPIGAIHLNVVVTLAVERNLQAFSGYNRNLGPEPYWEDLSTRNAR